MMSLVESAVLTWLEETADTLDSEAAAQREPVASSDQAASLISAKLLTIDSRLDKLTNKLLDGTIPQETYERLRDELQVQKKALESAVIAAQGTAVKDSEVVDTVRNWGSIDVGARRDLLSRLIEYVEVKPGRPRAVIQIVPRW